MYIANLQRAEGELVLVIHKNISKKVEEAFSVMSVYIWRIAMESKPWLGVHKPRLNLGAQK